MYNTITFLKHWIHGYFTQQGSRQVLCGTLPDTALNIFISLFFTPYGTHSHTRAQGFKTRPKFNSFSSLDLDCFLARSVQCGLPNIFGFHLKAFDISWIGSTKQISTALESSPIAHDQETCISALSHLPTSHCTICRRLNGSRGAPS